MHRLISTTHALRYLKRLPNSSSGAIVVTCSDGKEYVLKYKANEQSAYGTSVLIAEYLCYLLAVHYGLPIPRASIVHVGREFAESIHEDELRQKLKNSIGNNFGSEMLKRVIEVSGSMLTPLDCGFRHFPHLIIPIAILSSILYGFDQYIYNRDRMWQNPNILYIPKDKTISIIDHSMAIWHILDYSEDILEHYDGKDHVFYKFLKYPGEWRAMIKRAPAPDIKGYVDSVPDEWLNKDMTRSFFDQISRVEKEKHRNHHQGVLTVKNRTYAYTYQFAIVRFLPDFVREEFVNVGLILLDMTHVRFRARMAKTGRRIRAFDTHGSYARLLEYSHFMIEALESDANRIRSKKKEMSEKDMSSLFSDATKETAGMISFSNIKSGITDNVAQEFTRLYRRFVLSPWYKENRV